MSNKWIYRLEELGHKDYKIVGKKCANLGEMINIGMRVPPGFALSVDAYTRFMELTGLGKKIREYFSTEATQLSNNVAGQLQASQVVQEMIRNTAMPAIMADEIISQYRSVCKQCELSDVAMAVRSSGAVSMPGQMDTFLNISGEQNIIEKVIAVWESAFNARAIAFRLEKGMPVEEAPIGVAVLKMVNAKSAGVSMTVVPTTGELDKVVIEGNWGLGESVVSGDINPDHFSVDKKTLAIDKSISKKTCQVVATENGSTKAEVPPEMQDLPCLNDDEILQIVRIGMHVETHFGVAQDMEWVIDKDLHYPDNIIWVQTRAAKYTEDSKSANIEYLLDKMVEIFRRTA